MAASGVNGEDDNCVGNVHGERVLERTDGGGGGGGDDDGGGGSGGEKLLVWKRGEEINGRRGGRSANGISVAASSRTNDQSTKNYVPMLIEGIQAERGPATGKH